MTYRNPPAPPHQHATFTVYGDVSTLKVASKVPHRYRQGSGNTRGRVSQFSKRSRHRMIKTIAKMRNLDTGLFVTLTWPGALSNDYENWKRQLQTFFKRLRRFIPEARCIWRMEFKVRLSGDMEGFIAPHVHLLLFGIEDYMVWGINPIRGWIAENWHAICGMGDTAHLSAGTQADVIHSRKHATRYASKYAAKADGTFSIVAPVGRHWGYWGDWDLSALLTVSLTYEQMGTLKVELSRMLRASDNLNRWKYGMKVLRAPPQYGFSVLGMGDSTSPELGGFENQQVFRALSRIVSR